MLDAKRGVKPLSPERELSSRRDRFETNEPGHRKKKKCGRIQEMTSSRCESSLEDRSRKITIRFESVKSSIIFQIGWGKKSCQSGRKTLQRKSVP